LEVGDTAGLETCATIDHQFESHPLNVELFPAFQRE